MKANNQESASVPENKKGNQQVDRSRRTFAKLGVTIAPVMMTLVNRPAWGLDRNLCTRSGWTSLATFGSDTNYVAIKLNYTKPPQGANYYKLDKWQGWGKDNGLYPNPPFDDNFTVAQWQAFSQECNTNDDSGT